MSPAHAVVLPVYPTILTVLGIGWVLLGWVTDCASNLVHDAVLPTIIRDKDILVTQAFNILELSIGDGAVVLVTHPTPIGRLIPSKPHTIPHEKVWL